MTLLNLIFFCVGGIICLAPLTGYLGWLSRINRKDKPTVCNGSWDFIWLICGLSGFLLFGGTLLLSMLHSQTVVLIANNWQQAQTAMMTQGSYWYLTALGYFICLVSLVGFGVLGRADSLSVYNIDQQEAEGPISQTLAELGLQAQLKGHWWVNAKGERLVGLQPFNGLRHVTIMTDGLDESTADQLLRAIADKITPLHTGHNPSYLLIFSATICSFFTLMAFVMIIFLIAYETM